MPRRWYSRAISSRDKPTVRRHLGGRQSERVQSRYRCRSDHLPPMARNPMGRLAAPVGVHRVAYAGKLTCHPTSIPEVPLPPRAVEIETAPPLYLRGLSSRSHTDRQRCGIASCRVFL
jgi:hypothetical protein